MNLERFMSHIENFIDDEEGAIRERAKTFIAASGLDQVESLDVGQPQDPELPARVLGRLVPFFDSGFLVQSKVGGFEGNWWITDIFWRGTPFHVEQKDRIRVDKLIPEITPLQVNRAPAGKILAPLKMDFLRPTPEADAFIVKPTPSLAFVLICALAEPWASEHVSQAHRLINKSFIY